MKRGEKGKLNTRIWMLIAIFVAMLGVLLIFLDKLAIRETEAYSAAVQQTTKVRSTTSTLTLQLPELLPHWALKTSS